MHPLRNKKVAIVDVLGDRIKAGVPWRIAGLKDPSQTALEAPLRMALARA